MKTLWCWCIKTQKTNDLNSKSRNTANTYENLRYEKVGISNEEKMAHSISSLGQRGIHLENKSKVQFTLHMVYPNKYKIHSKD